jgi:HD-like signal output (HDOD) protein
LISLDPALTVKLLTFCNSASFGLSQKVDSVFAAIHLLGFRTIYRIVATTSARSLLVPPAKEEVAEPRQDPWSHAVLTAFAAQFVAEDVGIEPSTMFTAGLLHDLGRVILMRGFKLDYLRVEEEAGLDEKRLAEREAEAFGVTSAQVGGELLALWRFIPPIINAVKYRDNPIGAEDESVRRLSSCLHLSNELALSAGEGSNETSSGTALATVSMGILNRSAADMARYKLLIRENMKFIEAMCRLN